MRKLAIAMALASTAIAGPALARDKAWYIGVEGGASIVEDISFDIGTNKNAAKLDLKNGYDVDGIIGYDFGAFRLEAEVGYKEARNEAYTSSLVTPRNGATTLPAPAGTGRAVGKVSVLSFMMNGLLDFGDDTGLNGFVGGGVGVARIKQNASINVRSFLDDSDTGFAYQAIAGIRAPLSYNVDVGLKYRFFNADGIDTIDSLGRANRSRYRSHSLLGSLIYNFGSPPAPVCTPGPFIVFFEWDKSDVTPEAASILDGAVANYANCGTAQVELRGYTDTSGTPKYNLGLSQRRADAVSAYMQSKGIAGGVITTKALGETNLRVETADGVRELQNRRVEIMYGAGAGM